MKSIKFNIAHTIARQLKGNYSARMSFSLKLVNKSLDQLRVSHLSSDDLNGHGKVDFHLYCKGLYKYWGNMTQFYALSDEIIDFIKSDLSGFDPEKILNELKTYKAKILA